MSSPTPQSAGAPQIFRQAALDRLSSPEQLDRLVTIARPRDWLGLATILALVALALVWSLFASVPTRVTGSGIFVPAGGRLSEAVSPADGTVVALSLQPGDGVQAGQILVRLGRPDLSQALENARLQAADLERELGQSRNQTGAYAAARAETLKARRAALQQSAASAADRAQALERRLTSYEALQRQGYASATTVEGVRQELAAARQGASDARAQMSQLEADEASARNQSTQTVSDAGEKLAQARRHVQELALQLQQTTDVPSPASGRVTEVKTAVGARVGPGTPLASIETGRSGLQLLLYLPPDQGKRVKPGMDVRISPSTAKKEEFGTLVGVVRSVSEFPSTPEGLRGVLQNDQLVRQFSAKGPPFAARIDLFPSSQTRSGYRWASGKGPDAKIGSGTLAEADVTVRSQPPISFVLPFLRKASGL